jgi:hypothetical protein
MCELLHTSLVVQKMHFDFERKRELGGVTIGEQVDINGPITEARVLINRDCSAIAGCRNRRVRTARDVSGDFLPPSPPAREGHRSPRSGRKSRVYNWPRNGSGYCHNSPSSSNPALHLIHASMRAALAELDEGTFTEGLELDLKTVSRHCEHSAKVTI